MELEAEVAKLKEENEELRKKQVFIYMIPVNVGVYLLLDV